MSRKKLIITSVVLALILLIGGILAYFTDVETKTNKFKMGGANITVTEPHFPGDENTPVDIVPGKEVSKDPIVTNVGDGEVYAFVEVTIPKANVKIGSQTSPSEQLLFKTNYIADASGSAPVYAEGINPEWVLIRTTQNAASGTTPASTTFVYAYGAKVGTSDEVTLTPLAKTEHTPAVFDSVTFAEVVEDNATLAATSYESIQGKDYNVVVTGYGIQTEGLETTDAGEIFDLAKGN